MNPRTSLITISTVVALALTAEAQLVFDDGDEHTITFTTEDVVVTNQSRLIADEVSTTYAFSVNNGTLDVRGGSVGSIRLDDGELRLSGGVMSVLEFGEMRVGIFADGASTISLLSGAEVFRAFSTGLALQGSSRLMIDGGVINGHVGLDGNGTSATMMTAGQITGKEPAFTDFTCGAAVNLQNEATFEMAGGSLTSCEIGVITTGRSRFEMTGGTITVKGEVPRSAIDVQDQSRVVLADTRIDVADGSPASRVPIIRVSNESALQVKSGEYDLSVINANRGDNAFIVVDDDARVTIEEGTFTAFFGEAAADAVLFDVGESTYLNIAGGTFDLTQIQADWDVPPLAGIVWASNGATVDISGGSFSFAQRWQEQKGSRFVPVDFVDHLQAKDESRITIHGSSFNYAFGDVPNEEGTITGVLADGTPIEWQFRRDATARIVLVPEPWSWLLSAIGVIGIWRRFHSQAGKL